jgi:hypothetical protein
MKDKGEIIIAIAVVILCWSMAMGLILSGPRIQKSEPGKILGRGGSK